MDDQPFARCATAVARRVGNVCWYKDLVAGLHVDVMLHFVAVKDGAVTFQHVGNRFNFIVVVNFCASARWHR